MADVLDPAEAASQGRDEVLTEENSNNTEIETDNTTNAAPVIQSPTTLQHESHHQNENNQNFELSDHAADCNTLEEDETDDGNAVTTDILQQAFVEASGGEITHIDDEEQNLCLSPDKQQLEELATSVDQVGNDVVGDVAPPSNYNNTLPNIDAGTPNTFSPSDVPIQPSPAAVVEPSNTNSQTFSSVNTTESVVSSTPLGSKNNPIRIIQQGNTYKSTQKLSQEQIQQIVQVLQKQNLAAKTVNGGPTAVYNPETNTRIVYRIVQPHEKVAGSAGTAKSSGKSRGPHYPGRARGRPKKRQRTQSESSISDDGSEPPFDGESDSEGGDMSHLGGGELSPTEKLRKKREKPRTRSGRVSKPPSHMVKDYKQIHRVDWYEDYDDDDGGYSDIYDSGNEGRTSQQSENVESKKKYGCGQCEKSYIGLKSLARHYRMTGHGDPAELIVHEETSPKADSNENVDPTATGDSNDTPSAAGISRGKVRNKPKKRSADDGVWRPPAHFKVGDPGKSGRPSNSEQSLLHSLDGPGPGRPAMTFWERRVKRMEKLKSMLSAYSCTEVLQSMAPRLKKDKISLYDVMDAGLATAADEQRPSYTCMLQLYTELQAKMTELAKSSLRPLLEGESVAEDKEAIQIVTEVIAHSIGIEPGLFEVSDLPKPALDPPAGADDQQSKPTDKMEQNDEPVSADVNAAALADGMTEDSEVAPANKQLDNEAIQAPMDTGPEPSPAAMDTESNAAAAAPVEQVTANSASAIAEAVSKLMPGDIITLDGQKIVIPEGAHIVQSEEGVIIYASKEPDADCIINLKLGS